jgi:transposase
VPSTPQRELRELTRTRSSRVEERACVVNRSQQVLEEAKRKLAAVVSDRTGLSARAILARDPRGVARRPA